METIKIMMKTTSSRTTARTQSRGTSRKIRVAHIFPHLLPGGAERMVVHLMSNLDPDRFDVVGVCLAGPLGNGARASGRPNGPAGSR